MMDIILLRQLVPIFGSGWTGLCHHERSRSKLNLRGIINCMWEMSEQVAMI